MYVSVLLLLACSGEPGPTGTPAPGGSRSPGSALVLENGGTLNGGTLNGGTLNGNDLTDVLVKVRFQGAVVHGNAVLDYAELRGTKFWGSHSSAIFTGEEFMLADFPGIKGDGSQIRLRINGIRPGQWPNTDLTEYFVEHLTPSGAWKPVCYDPQTRSSTWAIPVAGHWDYRQGIPGGGDKIDEPGTFTFACLSGAIAKCVLLGYRPWDTYDGKWLGPYHQACTRLIRADYCGDGASRTVEGSEINLYDLDLGIQKDEKDWMFEAEWGPYGARCIHPTNRTHADIPCYNERLDILCGHELSRNRGALFWNETPFPLQ